MAPDDFTQTVDAAAAVAARDWDRFDSYDPAEEVPGWDEIQP